MPVDIPLLKALQRRASLRLLETWSGNRGGDTVVAEEERWITTDNGKRMKIDDSGKITAGPGAGMNISDFGKHGPSGKKSQAASGGDKPLDVDKSGDELAADRKAKLMQAFRKNAGDDGGEAAPAERASQAATRGNDEGLKSGEQLAADRKAKLQQAFKAQQDIARASANKQSKIDGARRSSPGDTEPVVRDTYKAAETLEKLAPGTTTKQAAQMSGAPDEAVVDLSQAKGGAVRYHAMDDRFEATGTIRRAEDGKLEVRYDRLSILPDARGTGFGAELLNNQVHAAEKSGVSRIRVEAVGNYMENDLRNGYYAFPRMGFDGDLPGDWKGQMEANGAMGDALPADLQNATKVSDLMKTPQGREAWKKYGFPMELTLDTTPGSQGRKVFDAYYQSGDRKGTDLKVESAPPREMPLMEEGQEVPEPGDDEREVDIDLGIDDDEDIFAEIWDTLEDDAEPDAEPGEGTVTEAADKYADVDLTPTKGMQAAARNGVERHENGETGDGLKPETVSRANRIARGERLTPEHVREMSGWFARHGKDKQEPGTPWYAAWQLWGGNAGESWSKDKSAELDRKDEESKAAESAMTPADIPAATDPDWRHVQENAFDNLTPEAREGDPAQPTDRAQLERELRNARVKTNPNPSPRAKRTGKYRKGKVEIHGLTVAIENPKHSTRSGKAKDGTEWERYYHFDYGEIRDAVGEDGDFLDAYIGPDPASELVVIIDQIDQDTGEFDEHKVMLGWHDQAEAVKAYLQHYPADWRPGHVTALTVDQFKAWISGTQWGTQAAKVRDSIFAALESAETVADVLREFSSTYP